MRVYSEAITRLADWLESEGLDTSIQDTERQHLEAFMVALLQRYSPATAHNRYRALKTFFAWAEDEDEIERSPMAKMSPPYVPEPETRVLSEQDVIKLLKACAGKGFSERRDSAIIRLFGDTGIRRTELAALRLSDVDFDHSVVFVTGKGRRPRSAPFGCKTVQALDRYIRLRSRRKDAWEEALWLGKRGPMGVSGVQRVVRERGKQAGLEVHPHMLRHSLAHHWLPKMGPKVI